MDTLFPADRRFEITPDTRPLTQTGSIAVYILLAEDRLFLQGFDENERLGRPPTLLRGALVVRVLKPSKIKNIQLTFTGTARTEWPEGIPPKRSEYFEENVLINHTWPFYTASTGTTSGADLVKSPSAALQPVLSNGSVNTHHADMSSLSLDTLMSVRSPSSPLALLKRVASPSPERTRRRSASVLSQESVGNTGDYYFQPGDYVYNFEHPIPASFPETIDATFGSVNYHLEVLIERYGAFKSNITTKLPITIIRAQSDDSVEDSEPIAISRDWEDQLHYDIIIASKAVVLNAYIPVAFKLVPLDKIKLHRIRIYMTESMEYYCRNKKVHRMQPTKKYMLLEHKAPPPPDLPPDADAKAKKMGNLLTSDGYDLTAKEFEFQVYVPQKLNSMQKLHPNTSYQNVKVHHWVKICLRLSRMINGKPKHYEISIDSPIHILHQLCSHANTLLPAYDQPLAGTPQNHGSNIYFPMDVISSPPLSPEVEAFDHTPQNSIYLALGRDAYHGRSNSSSTLNHSLPNFESTLSANVYKPSNLEIELTSPQAVPLSPQLSPMVQPFALEDSNDPPPPFEDEEISPPRPMISARAALSMSPLARPTSLASRDIGAVGGGAVGIDAIMDAGSPPLDPPKYRDVMKNEASSRILDGPSDAPEITLTRSSEDSKTGDPGDLGEDFAFSGQSPIMPESVMKSTSPERQRVRAAARSRDVSPRVSLDFNRADMASSGPQQLQDLDAVLHGRGSIDENDNDDNDARDSRSRFSSRSSLSPGSPRRDFAEGMIGMEPLLATTSTISDSQYAQPPVPYYSSSRWESRESLSRRESASVDITALYQSDLPSFSRTSIFEPSSSMITTSNRHPSIASSKRSSLDSRRESTNATTPVLSTLNQEPSAVIDEENESMRSKSEESSLRDNQSSHSTLTSAHEEHGNNHGGGLLQQKDVIHVPLSTEREQIS
ncbi:Arrestin-related trafficking adapter 3 [Cyberlindnera fabianii]|uniref:Arrestin-related trafficking adapter 3 n=1 Tax=Cyberlindnera fabianii TaxID=36022 RepID=A0A1V2LER4_CYBFA|nr:Arrestin-related trafficking adapter 3 [Cyberlindnera fabianii]